LENIKHFYNEIDNKRDKKAFEEFRQLININEKELTKIFK
jgi:hypothetical protein